MKDLRFLSFLLCPAPQDKWCSLFFTAAQKLFYSPQNHHILHLQWDPLVNSKLTFICQSLKCQIPVTQLSSKQPVWGVFLFSLFLSGEQNSSSVWMKSLNRGSKIYFQIHTAEGQCTIFLSLLLIHSCLLSFHTMQNPMSQKCSMMFEQSRLFTECVWLCVHRRAFQCIQDRHVRHVRMESEPF